MSMETGFAIYTAFGIFIGIIGLWAAGKCRKK